MKVAALVLAVLFMSMPASAQVAVQGYFKKDGTYVSPHVRTRPDGLCSNNYSGC